MKDPEKAIESPFYERAAAKAAKLAKDGAKALIMLTAAGRRLNLLKVTGEKLVAMKSDIGDLIDMLKSYYNGRYKDIPYATIVKSLGAVVYFVWIIDLIPDFIPMFGLLDDAAVVAWVITSVQKDVERFRRWREKLPEYVDEETQTPETTSQS